MLRVGFLLVVLTFWSLLMWFGASLIGWAASLGAGAIALLLPQSIDAATTWLIHGIGDIIQGVVAIAWAIIALIIVGRMRLFGRA